LLDYTGIEAGIELAAVPGKYAPIIAVWHGTEDPIRGMAMRFVTA